MLVLTAVAYRATRKSQESTELLVEQRRAEQMALLWLGLAQDMEGAQRNTLMPVTFAQLASDPPYELADIFANAFARFPYAESFFASVGDDWTAVRVFNRAGRPPPWQRSQDSGPYPVQILRAPDAMRGLIARARREAQRGQHVTAFATSIEQARYQVVLRFLTDPGVPPRDGLPPQVGAVGFTVNMDWIRESYFRELTSQISRISPQTGDISLEILDADLRTVAATADGRDDIPALRRPFPLLFMDRSLLRVVEPDEIEQWTARVRLAGGSQLAASATAGSSGAFLLLAAAALTTMAALVATARQMRAASELAVMKSEFVADVTHDLKAPLAVIQLIAETLGSGRYESPLRIVDYARLLQGETLKFSRLIDNVLSAARLSDASFTPSFAPAHVHDLVDEALEGFRTILLQHGFTIDICVPEDLPPVHVDRLALLRTLDNLIDNAIKYSPKQRELRIVGRADARMVSVAIADRGMGIDEDEIDHVCEKFFRGRGVKSGGSGLGLSIALQTVHAHGGRLTIESERGEGTRVELLLPIAKT